MKPFLQVITQRLDKDCAVAVVAMLLDIGYEQSFMAFRGKVWKHGASNRQITNACRRLGYRTAWKLKPDLENDTGLLFIAFADRLDVRHIVLLDEGRIFDTDSMVWDVDQYISTKKALPGELLIVAGKLKE